MKMWFELVVPYKEDNDVLHCHSEPEQGDGEESLGVRYVCLEVKEILHFVQNDRFVLLFLGGQRDSSLRSE